jgi:hypothetical protein
VGGVHRQRRLPEARGPGHHGDPHRARPAGRLVLDQHLAQVPDLLLAACEVPNVGRELRRARRWRAGRFLDHPGGGGDRADSDRPRPFPVQSANVFRADERLDLDEAIGTCAGSGGSGPGVGRPRGTRRRHGRGAWRLNRRKVPLNRPLPRPRRRGVSREQPRVQLLQLGTGIDAKLIGDHLPGLGVRLERFGMPGTAREARVIELPWRMQHLARDKRGYPVPWVVLVDKAGRPHFTVNDQDKVEEVIKRDLCSICGRPNTRGRWFVGGPLSAFHPRGAYYDPPMHAECARFALQVCPYLAVREYTGRIENRTLKEPVALSIDKTVIPDRPPLFVNAMAIKQKVDRTHFIPHKPFHRVEFWRDGQQISEAEAWPIVKAHVDAPLPPLQSGWKIL